MRRDAEIVDIPHGISFSLNKNQSMVVHGEVDHHGCID